ncbi:hypothetical protein BTJ40_05790 [Microbulbifer sp. A4B17]|uniref:hypothetical protein n=1 Tax=Microbulbifer sp. A4B17 TaxID=359370 RepID=UPI000D52E439|nr:hypothetical protein [Microbulbifer sp. A4B17]AWF80360.1 hypothetical protein BTJ40_05790 [Microbulbifer sp. A4B17]
MAFSSKQQSKSALIAKTTYLATLISSLCVIGGIYLAFFNESLAEVKFNLFGNEFSSNSLGVAIAFIGVVLIGIVLSRVLLSVDRSTLSGGLGGNAEVIGDGEARGGKGGSSGSFGPGGNGGNAKVIGKGKAIGGDGGNG